MKQMIGPALATLIASLSSVAAAKPVTLSCTNDTGRGLPLIVKFDPDSNSAVAEGRQTAELNISEADIRFKLVSADGGYRKWYINRVDGRAITADYDMEDGRLKFIENLHFTCTPVANRAF